MASKFLPLSFFSIFFLIVFVIEANKDLSFTIDLIHRDSPMSPLHNPLETHHERIKKVIHRSISRVTRFKTSFLKCPTSSIQPQPKLIPDEGEYLMNISIGTPPVEYLGIMDTGSDLTWTQCKPCDDCFNQTIPMFNPKYSSTYKELSCRAKPCEISKDPTYSCQKDKCMYEMRYADNSHAAGNVATETFTIKSSNERPVLLRNIVFGCGHRNQGSFNGHGSGVIGLGGGNNSFISQLKNIIDGKFSYCMVPYELNKSSSKMNFGKKAIVSGEGVVSTPIIMNPPEVYYYLMLEGISIAGKRISDEIKGIKTKEQRIIIDSGTTLTFLPANLYKNLESGLRNAIKHEALHEAEFELCYKVAGLQQLNVPLVTFHFTGADVVLQPLNLFFEYKDGLFCLAVLPDNQAIFGNFAQMNFLVGYDLQAGTVSFKPADCTKT